MKPFLLLLILQGTITSIPPMNEVKITSFPYDIFYGEISANGQKGIVASPGDHTARIIANNK